VIYYRDFTEEIVEGQRTIPIGPGTIGEADAVGVCDDQMQIDLCRKAQKFLGSRKYESSKNLPAEYGFPSYPATGNSILRCNIFVAHMGVSAGLQIPKINGYFYEYPPLANEWAGEEFTGVIPGANNYIQATWIPHWEFPFAGTTTLSSPQPGWIIGHPNPGDAGHVGIIDYDGGGIGAGFSGTVNKNFEEFFDGTSKYRRYSE
jgi:hypothetical protein